MENKQAEYWIGRFGMSPHPEGGYYREMYRADHWSPVEGLSGKRRILTTIYYLLEKDDFSAFHRIKSPESWFFHKGDPLLIYSIEQGKLVCRELSDKEEGQLQVTIEPGVWFAARLKKPEGYTLVSCAVAPGFEYKDFELAEREALLVLYPGYTDEIKRLTR